MCTVSVDVNMYRGLTLMTRWSVLLSSGAINLLSDLGKQNGKLQIKKVSNILLILLLN